MIPEWLKTLRRGDEILCYFGFSGRYLYVTIEDKLEYPFGQNHSGYWARYSDECESATWTLSFEHYSTAPERDHWIAYQVEHGN